MVRRAIAFVGLVALATAACSGNPERASRLAPTGPSAAAAATLPGDIVGGGVSRPSAVFPSRTDELDFRQQLETTYAPGLGRSAGATAVDREGDVVWVSEYIRYRVDGCDHATAIQRVLAQVDGGAPGPVCGTSPTGAIAFPPRNETFDFRQQLETKYQGMGRSSSSAVDIEGSAIWTQEYLRYRTNACDHAASVSNTLTQVDGNSAPATCYVPPACSFITWGGPTLSMSDLAGSSSVELVANSGSGCTWTGVSEASWLTLTGGNTGGDRNLQAFSVTRNTGGPRTGYIRFNWTGGSVRYEVIQAATTYNLSFSMFDFARSAVAATTQCYIQGNPTTCTLSSVTNALPQAVATYNWRVEYGYGGAQVKTQVSASNVFAFTQGCGGTTTAGEVIDLAVTLTATDTAGNNITLYSGQGNQPALSLRIFPCP